MLSQHMPQRPVRKCARILTRSLRYRRKRLPMRNTDPAMTKQPTPYTIRSEKIAEALRGLLTMRPGRSFRRYAHGQYMRVGKRRYFIGYTWTRTHANPMTGVVHDVILADGDDFDSALAAAVAKLKKAAP